MSTRMPVELDIGDRTLRLALTLSALADAEAVTGRNYLDGETWGRLTAADVRAIVWGAAHACDPAVTLEEVGDLIDLGMMGSVNLALAEMFAHDLPESGDDGGGGGDDTGPLPSPISGRSPDMTSGSKSRKSGKGR